MNTIDATAAFLRRYEIRVRRVKAAPTTLRVKWRKPGASSCCASSPAGTSPTFA